MAWLLLIDSQRSQEGSDDGVDADPTTLPHRGYGGPGGGKITAADPFRSELGERVVVVPESAAILFKGGFPRSGEENARRAAQTGIYHVQRNIEDE